MLHMVATILDSSNRRSCHGSIFKIDKRKYESDVIYI